MKTVGDRGQMIGRADLDRRLAGIVDLSGSCLDALLEVGIELNQPLVGGEQFEALALEQPLGLMTSRMLALDAALEAPRAVVQLFKRTGAGRISPPIK